MPLRDHFRPPLESKRHWESMHATWPVTIVARLRPKLPKGFFAEPRVHLGITELPAQDVFEVRVYDEQHGRRLVAAVEIASPANKDRPETRRMFAAKCASLMHERVSVVIVDVVTTRTSNLYGELLELIGHSDPRLGAEPPLLYTNACRMTKQNGDWRLETWLESLSLGAALPTMPLWLADNLAVPLELEKSYEDACEILGITALSSP